MARGSGSGPKDAPMKIGQFDAHTVDDCLDILEASFQSGLWRFASRCHPLQHKRGPSIMTAMDFCLSERNGCSAATRQRQPALYGLCY